MTLSPPTVMIMAGGTGGHIYPGLAVAQELQSRGVQVRWLGARGGMETRTVPDFGISIDLIDITGVRGKGLKGWLLLPFRLFSAVRQASHSMHQAKPACALSFGGYVAGPGGLAARWRGIPLVVHEQNRIPGLTNRVLARLAKKVLQAFPDTFPAKIKARTCGNPVRKDVVTLPSPDIRFAGRQGNLRILITGGSQGAQSLNRVVPQAVALLPERLSVNVLHQAGKGQMESTRGNYPDQSPGLRVEEFITDMAAAYSWADLVICRAGALTVSELAAVGIAAILVPYPHAVDDHQTLNASFLTAAGAAVLLPETELSPEGLARTMSDLLADRAKLMDMASAGRALAMPEAAQVAADACAEWLG